MVFIEPQTFFILCTDEVLVSVSGAENMGLKAASRREHESIVENYKELIKEQVSFGLYAVLVRMHFDFE